MRYDALSHDETYRLRCENNCLYIDTLQACCGCWRSDDLGLYVHSRLLAITSDGQYIAFVDDDTSTLFVCQMTGLAEFIEIGRIADFPVESFCGLEWDEQRLALLGIYPCQAHGQQRLRYETTWHPEPATVAA